LTAGDQEGAALGAPLATGEQPQDGVVFVFAGTPSGTLGKPFRQFAGSVPGARLGNALAAGDLNDDGLQDLLMGSLDQNAGAGAAYLAYGRPKLQMATIATESLGAGCSGDLVTLQGKTYQVGQSVTCTATQRIEVQETTVAAGARLELRAPVVRLGPGTRVVAGGVVKAWASSN